MSYGYADLRRRISEPQESKPEAKREEPVEVEYAPTFEDQVQAPAKSPKRPRGTSPFPQVKLPREVYNDLKVVAGLTGKTVPQMLERFVAEGVDSFRNLTVDQLLSK